LLRQLIEAEGLSTQVELAGAVFQEDLSRYLAQALIFVLPCVVARDGDRDGIPNALIEAMAMEIPTVSTQVSGIPELVQPEQTGLLVPPGDPAALADALARLLDDADLRVKLGRAGRARVVESFEIEKNTQELVRIFQAALNLPSAPGPQPHPLAQSSALAEALAQEKPAQ
jgi:glycosyltransferase involved in cell wall biosynthesis